MSILDTKNTKKHTNTQKVAYVVHTHYNYKTSHFRNCEKSSIMNKIWHSYT